MQTGKYIVLEGHACAGKTTQISMLEEWLKGEGLGVARTREPGGPEAAEEIRRAIFSLKQEGRLSQMDEVWMFYAARGYSMEWVEEQLGRGNNILKDRDYLSTRLIQAETGVALQNIEEYHRKLYVERGFREPDLRIMMLLTEEELRRRLVARGAGGDAFDNDMSFALAVQRRYIELAYDLSRNRGGGFQRNTVVVDGEGDKGVVFGRIQQVVGRSLRIEGAKKTVEGVYFPGEGAQSRVEFETGMC